MNITAGTIARTITLAIALLNQTLAIFGRDTLPFAEDDIYQLTSLIFTFISSAIAWWKNNSFTKDAIKADNVLLKLKKNE